MDEPGEAWRRALRRFIGPPLRQSFGELLGTDDAGSLDAALRHYRDRFSVTGLFENTLYPFVPGALAALQAARHRMWVVTSRPTVYATRSVEHFLLTPYFEAVHGSELTGERSDKVELVAHVLSVEELDPAQTWMIGDRAHDIRGGRSNGTHTAGVLWGYGSRQELAEAGADIIVETMDPLIARFASAGHVLAANEANAVRPPRCILYLRTAAASPGLAAEAHSVRQQ